MTEKIYIHLIDGSDAWIEVDVERLVDDQYKVNSFGDFDPTDPAVIPQFIPGDIVTKKQIERNGEKFWTADRLVKPSDNANKKYFEFLYRTITGNKLKNEEERFKYEMEIIRTRNEIKEGKFHYPAIANYVNGIETK